MKNHDSFYAGDDHLVQRGAGRDGDTGAVIGLCLTLEDAGDLAELAANLFDHLIRGLGNGIHGQRREREREHTAYCLRLSMPRVTIAES